MNDRFPYRVTIIPPASLVAGANQLALCYGTDPADAQTFGDDRRAQNGSGDLFHFAHTQVSGAWLAATAGTVTAPDFAPDADVAAAQAAQAALVRVGFDLSGAEMSALGAVAAGPADPAKITVVIGPNVTNQLVPHLAAVGLTVIGGA